MADVFGVLTGRVAIDRGLAGAGISEELEWFLIHHDERPGRVVGAGVHPEHVFHRRTKGGVMVGWDRPAGFQVRLKRPLFRTRPIVE